MRFSVVSVLVSVVSITVISTASVQAKTLSPLSETLWSQKSVESSYSLTNDPLLLEWSFKKPLSEEKVVVKDSFVGNISAYTAAADECGKSDGITASGKKVAAKRTLACPKNYAFGTKVYIEGMGEYSCEDRGGAIKGNKFDIYVETKKEAFAFGRQKLEVSILQ